MLALRVECGNDWETKAEELYVKTRRVSKDAKKTKARSRRRFPTEAQRSQREKQRKKMIGFKISRT
ncbi:MAG: hypothetical protein ACI89L_002272 [Phycisphaerales bacterium]|jgi:hypothetical protein